MLYKLRTLKELDSVSSRLPQRVCQEARRILKILENAYGENAQWVCALYIGTEKRDFENFRKLHPHLVLEDYEFLDWIECGQEERYTSILYILSADDSISILMPEKYLPEEILKENEKRKKQ